MEQRDQHRRQLEQQQRQWEQQQAQREAAAGRPTAANLEADVGEDGLQRVPSAVGQHQQRAADYSSGDDDR
jgi:hypothetical protein